jgi:hypothetical protein
MAAPDLTHPHEKYVVASALLTVAGLGTALVYTLSSTPYTMVLFLGVGQLCIALGMVMFMAVVILDVRSRLQSVVERRFKTGDVVFKQGDFPDRLYLIGRGEAEVIRTDQGKDIVLARLKAGEFFGEMGILGNTPRTATVKAATDLETLSIHRNYFGPLLAYLPAWRERLFDEYRLRSGAPPAANSGASEEGRD